MSLRLFGVTLFALALGATGRVNGQVPGDANRSFLLINTTRTNTLQSELSAAGQAGFAVVAAGDFSVLLKRDGKEPRTYQCVATDDDPKLLSAQLTQAGAQGFKLVPSGVWKLSGRFAVILERQADGDRFTYDVVAPEDAATIKSHLMSGARRVATIDTFLIMERHQGSKSMTPSGVDYRLVSTSRPATLEKEIMDAAKGGYRAVGAGKMTVVMERDPASSSAVEYRVVAAARLPTFRRELQAAGAEGFQIVVIPTRDNEVVAVLERPSGTARKLEYVVEEVAEKSVDQKLRALDADGYSVERISGVRLLAFASRAMR
jgi:hypothetical protein